MSIHKRSELYAFITLLFLFFSLLPRVSALRFFLQTQDRYGLCIANIQQELQEYWELLEDLHTKVTLQPEKCQGLEEPHSVLNDAEVGL